MQETTQHLLDGVVGLTCVDSSIHPSICAAPLVVSIITQQCLYVCHTASSCQALLNEGASSFWHIMRRVAEARERYTALRAPPPPQPSLLRRSKTCMEDPPAPSTDSHTNSYHGSSRSDSTATIAGSSGDRTTGKDNLNRNTFQATRRGVVASDTQPVLSPLEFRVVVVGGGRVGRAIVERLLQASHLIHPSRITIITRQTEKVAEFAGRGVQCTGRRDGLQALRDCHVLILACQQTQFFDFASIYCPRQTQRRPKHTTVVEDNCQPEKESPSRKNRVYLIKKRTLRDVVDKWRTMEDDDYVNDVLGAPMTRLLKPGTLVFSCCAALETHKIAKELGHLDPLVVSADVDLNAVNAAARQFQNAKERYRSAFVHRVVTEGNSFLTALNALQRTYMSGQSPSADLTTDILQDPYCTKLRTHGRRPLSASPPNMTDALRGEDVSGSTSLLLSVWRALRCFVVARIALLKPTEHRLFTYMQCIGPMLGPILVALPIPVQECVVGMVKEILRRKGEGYDDDDDNNIKKKFMIKLNQQVVPAYDSDGDESDNGGEGSNLPSHEERELERLILCFPSIFKNEEEVLQLLREQYIAVTEK